MNEAIDHRDDAGRVRENLVPFGERLVGAEHDWLAGVVSTGHHLEQQVGVVRIPT